MQRLTPRATVSTSEPRGSATPPPQTMITSPDILKAKIGQRNAVDMAIRFKALKMGASVEMINGMTVFALLDWILDNA